MITRDEFRVSSAQSAARTFRGWAEELLPSKLALELVENGFITSYFPLHVSTFYGQLIRPDAMTYIMRNVDRGVPDPEYPLQPEDVDAIIAEQGPTVLTDRSMRNVSILDRLLDTDSSAAETVIRLVASDGANGVGFTNRYLTAGKAKAKYVSILVRHWPSTFSYLVADAPVGTDERAALLGTAIEHRGDLAYEVTPDIAAFIQTNVANVTPLVASNNPSEAQNAVGFLTEVGAVLPTVSDLSEFAKDAIKETRAFKLSAENLELLTGTDDLALDTLRDLYQQLYSYALENPVDYLEAVATKTENHVTIAQPGAFVAVISDAQAWPGLAIDTLVRRSVAEAHVDSLALVPISTWGALVRDSRTVASFDNVLAYIGELGSVDDPLAALLSNVGDLETARYPEDEDRPRVALAIINAASSELSDELRVSLAKSTKPGELESDVIRARSGSLIGQLITARIIRDDEDAFTERLMVDWETQEYAILASGEFVNFVGPSTLQSAFIAPLMNSDTVPVGVQLAVSKSLDGYETVPRDAYIALSNCALRGRVWLGAKAIQDARGAGVGTDIILRLLAHAGERVSIEDLRRLLRGLGEPYSLIADKGTRRPALKDTEANRAVVGRLRTAGIVKGSRPEKRDQLRISLHQG